MKALLFISFFSLSLTATAVIGPSTGGGGDVVIMPDDSVVLADPFLDSNAQQPNNMPPVRSLNPRLLQVVDSYLRASLQHLESLTTPKQKNDSRPYMSDVAVEMKALSLRNNKLRYYGVRDQNELNTFCAPGGRKSYTLPTGAKVEQVACTAGTETFLVEPLFIRLSLKDQALLLIHERLTTLRDAQGGKNYSAIARFTTGLSTYLSLYKEQAKKKYRTLTDPEQKNLTEFYIATEEIERRDSEITEDSFQWSAARKGGGRIHMLSDVDDDALIALGMALGRNSRVGKGSQIINSSFFGDKLPKLSIGENVSINGVALYSVESFDVGDGSNIVNNLFYLDQVKIGKHNEITDSDFRADFHRRRGVSPYFTSEDQVKIKNVSVNGIAKIKNSANVETSQLHLANQLVTENSHVKHLAMKLSTETLAVDAGVEVQIGSISNIIVDDESNAHYPTGSQHKSFNLKWKSSTSYEQTYEVSYDVANNIVEILKSMTNNSENGFFYSMKSNATFRQAALFGGQYLIRYNLSEFEVSFNAAQVSTEKRKNAYTVYNGQLLPAYKGVKSVQVRIPKYTQLWPAYANYTLRTNEMISKIQEKTNIKIVYNESDAVSFFLLPAFN